MLFLKNMKKKSLVTNLIIYVDCVILYIWQLTNKQNLFYISPTKCWITVLLEICFICTFTM